MLTACCL
jgi:hypothetical protein